jgi:ABC-type Fe3+ transport system substrate-binding protein
MSDDTKIEEVAAMMYAAALAFTNSIGRKGWAWEACDEQTKEYWRKIAKHVKNILNSSNEATPRSN